MEEIRKKQEYSLSFRDFEKEGYKQQGVVYVHTNIEDLDRPIFRYIQVGHLLSMLNQKTLYVPNRKYLLDASERGIKENVKNSFLVNIVSRNKKDNKARLDYMQRKRDAAYNVCVSCWTYDSLDSNSKDDVDENYLMWKSYGGNYVSCRIQTTIKELIHTIEAIEDVDILISNVEYCRERGANGTSQQYIFEKPIYYRDEKEVRLCVLTNKDDIKLKINPFQMIKQITLSPFIDKELCQFLKKTLKQEYPNWDVKVEKSHIMEYK